MENESKFLPIGTIVLLKGGKKELMITSYCIFPTGKLVVDGKEVDSKGVMYEYGACTYPEGIINSDQILGFNSDQIEKICHMGYETEEQRGFAEHLSMVIDELKEQVKNGTFGQEEGQE